MAKKKKDDKKESGGQAELFEIHGENAKLIVAAAVLYKKHQKARLAAAAKEAEQKALILELVKQADLQVLAGGKVKCTVDGMTITVTPRDELVQVKEATRVEVAPK